MSTPKKPIFLGTFQTQIAPFWGSTRLRDVGNTKGARPTMVLISSVSNLNDAGLGRPFFFRHVAGIILQRDPTQYVYKYNSV